MEQKTKKMKVVLMVSDPWEFEKKTGRLRSWLSWSVWMTSPR